MNSTIPHSTSHIPQSPARVLIVDDHAIVRYGMGVLLSGAKDLTLCGEAGTYDEALTAIRELKPDIAVIDLILYDRSGLDLIREIRSQESGDSNPQSTIDNRAESELGTAKAGQRSGNRQSQMPILVMSMHDEATHAEKALRAGAQGYIMKEDADEVLVEALRTVLSGKLHVSGNMNEKLLRTYVESDDNVESSGVESLTVREKEIFECLGKGFTTRKIAEQFNLSPRTVEVHRARIKKKLECEDAAQLLRTAVQWVESRTV
jgi:DNA-binding NarL/FixJ family response regulator